MAKLSNYLETELIDHVLRNAAYSSPTTVYIALFTTDPLDDAIGTEITGLGGYARQAAAFDAPTDGVTQNTDDEEFGPATESWGTITHVAIFDAVSTGNMLFHGILDTAKAVGDGDTFKIAAGDLECSLA